MDKILYTSYIEFAMKLILGSDKTQAIYSKETKKLSTIRLSRMMHNVTKLFNTLMEKFWLLHIELAGT